MLCNYTGTDQPQVPGLPGRGHRPVLEVSPGGTYNIEVASGQAAGLPLPPGDGRWTAAVACEGAFEAPAPTQQVGPPVLADLPPVLAAMAVAPVTPEEAGDSPAEEES